MGLSVESLAPYASADLLAWLDGGDDAKKGGATGTARAPLGALAGLPGAWRGAGLG